MVTASEADSWHTRMRTRTGDPEHTRRLQKTLPLLIHAQLASGDIDDALATVRRGVALGVLTQKSLSGAVFAALHEHPTFPGLFDIVTPTGSR